MLLMLPSVKGKLKLRQLLKMRQLLLTVTAATFCSLTPVAHGATLSEVSNTGQFLTREHLIIDLQSGVEWLRCSVGQQWNGIGCSGKIMKLNHDGVAKAIVMANEQLGGNWRLPTRNELEGLVCKTCSNVKIDIKTFPETAAEPYWTGEVNGFATRHFWSVNFMTGHTYGRFFPTQALAVRLVRNRNR